MSKLNKSQKNQNIKSFQLAILAGLKLIVIKETEDIKLFFYE